MWTSACPSLSVSPEKLGYTLSDAQAFDDTLADLQVEVEAETLGEKRSDAQALVDTLADSQEEV